MGSEGHIVSPAASAKASASRAVATRRPARRFSKAVLAVLHDSKILGIRAGVQPHRFLGVWVVVVNDRVFVRSWNDKPGGWYRAFAAEPRGAIQIGRRQIRVRAIKRRGERLMKAIEAAYKEKYNTRASRKYVIGFARPRRRATTIELTPR
jgi:hypothetical protein